METFYSTPSSSSRTSDSKPQGYSSSTPSPLPQSVFRLWRPAAQRNLRNQWSKLASFRNQWSSVSSAGRSQATSIVNSSLSQRYMPNMDLGVLSGMPDIRKKACFKLSKQQELLRSQLLSTYKDMVAVVSDIINTTRSMRCFFKGANNSPLLQFSSFSEDMSDYGDGGGVPVFSFLSIASHEKLAEELVHMFRWELCLKRLLMIEFLSIDYDISQGKQLNWSNELYASEFEHLQNCNLYCEKSCGPVAPRLRDGKSDMEALKFDNQPKPEVLQLQALKKGTLRLPGYIGSRKYGSVKCEVGVPYFVLSIFNDMACRSEHRHQQGGGDICCCWGGNACYHILNAIRGTSDLDQNVELSP